MSVISFFPYGAPYVRRKPIRGIVALGDETADFGGTDVDERGVRKLDTGGEGRGLHCVTGTGVDQDAMVA